MKHACAYCAADVDPSKPGAYREIVGWEKVRAGGGANAVTLRHETGSYACSTCIGALKSGIDPRRQRSMF